MTRWRLLDTGAHDGAWNMAADEALMDRARRTGESVFRIYAWSRATLTLGRHEAAARRFDRSRIAAHGVDVVRRPTGGRALLHDREVTYSVTAPVDPAEPLADSVRRINALLLGALQRLGVPAIEATAPRIMRPEGAACFAAPAPGELTLFGRKLAGSAQVRQGGALLQHGSILLDDDQGMIASFAVGPFEPAAPAASLREALGQGAVYSVVRDALRDEMQATCDAEAIAADEAGLDEAALAPWLARFRDDAWTWRR